MSQPRIWSLLLHESMRPDDPEPVADVPAKDSNGPRPPMVRGSKAGEEESCHEV